MGLIQFFKDRQRINQAGKVGKIDTDIQKYQAQQFKDENDWKKLAKLQEKKAKITEANKIKSERNTTTKITNNTFGFNFKGSQQVSSTQNNKTNSKSKKK